MCHQYKLFFFVAQLYQLFFNEYMHESCDFVRCFVEFDLYTENNANKLHVLSELTCIPINPIQFH